MNTIDPYLNIIVSYTKLYHLLACAKMGSSQRYIRNSKHRGMQKVHLISENQADTDIAPSGQNVLPKPWTVT